MDQHTNGNIGINKVQIKQKYASHETVLSLRTPSYHTWLWTITVWHNTWHCVWQLCLKLITRTKPRLPMPRTHTTTKTPALPRTLSTVASVMIFMTALCNYWPEGKKHHIAAHERPKNGLFAFYRRICRRIWRRISSHHQHKMLQTMWTLRRRLSSRHHLTRTMLYHYHPAMSPSRLWLHLFLSFFVPKSVPWKQILDKLNVWF
jgi:hypothetical protein